MKTLSNWANEIDTQLMKSGKWKITVFLVDGTVRHINYSDAIGLDNYGISVSRSGFEMWIRYDSIAYFERTWVRSD